MNDAKYCSDLFFWVYFVVQKLTLLCRSVALYSCLWSDYYNYIFGNIFCYLFYDTKSN